MADAQSCELCSMRINNLDPARQPVRNSANLCCQELARGTGDSLDEWVYVIAGDDFEAIEDMDDCMVASLMTVCSEDSIVLSASWSEGWSGYPGLLDCSETSMDNNENTPSILRYCEDQGGPWTAAGAGSSWGPGNLDYDELKLEVSALLERLQNSQVEDAGDQPWPGTDDETESATDSDSEVGDLELGGTWR